MLSEQFSTSLVALPQSQHLNSKRLMGLPLGQGGSLAERHSRHTHIPLSTHETCKRTENRRAKDTEKGCKEGKTIALHSEARIISRRGYTDFAGYSVVILLVQHLIQDDLRLSHGGWDDRWKMVCFGCICTSFAYGGGEKEAKRIYMRGKTIVFSCADNRTILEVCTASASLAHLESSFQHLVQDDLQT